MERWREVEKNNNIKKTEKREREKETESKHKEENHSKNFTTIFTSFLLRENLW